MKKMFLFVLISLVLLNACAVTKGTRTARHIANPMTQDSTLVLVVHEEYSETTTYPWAIAMGVLGLIGGLAYIVNNR